jgi:D-amino-acid dehydrogenase
MRNNNVVVIGAGIAGLSTSYYLNKAGLNVTVLDRDDGKDNCSYGNAGLIVPSHFIPLASPGIISKGLMMMLKDVSRFNIMFRLEKELFYWGWIFR